MSDALLGFVVALVCFFAGYGYRAFMVERKPTNVFNISSGGKNITIEQRKRDD